MEQQLIFCPNCGEGYWVTPMTLKIQCQRCGELVYQRGFDLPIEWEAALSPLPRGKDFNR
jgi:uncharacterized protein (DUF983 family)